MMMEVLQPMRVQDALQLVDRFVVAVSVDSASEDLDLPGDLSALLEVRRFPSRVGCVLLGWQELGRYLRKKADAGD